MGLYNMFSYSKEYIESLKPGIKVQTNTGGEIINGEISNVISEKDTIYVRYYHDNWDDHVCSYNLAAFNKYCSIVKAPINK